MKIAPSLLAADFSRLYEEVQSVEKAGIDMFHIDVMDGHFVPNISMGANVVQALRPNTNSILDVHLMIEDPDRYIPSFVDAGADMISVHVEACPHLHRTVQLIKSLGVKAGVAVNPATPIEAIKYVINDVDFVLIMTVNPGFGGQSFIETMLEKIKETRALINTTGKEIDIEVDGGITVDTLKMCREHGANVFVAGSAIFKQTDRIAMIKKMYEV